MADEEEKWLESLKVGDKITVWLDETLYVSEGPNLSDVCCAGIILETKGTNIKIELVHLVDDELINQIWIDGKSNRIDRNPSRIYYDDLPMILQSCSVSGIVYYKGEIIVLLNMSDSMDLAPGLYSYNIADATFEKKADIPNEHAAEVLGLALNRNANELYIVDTSRLAIATYNLQSQQWTVEYEADEVHKMTLPHVLYAPEPADALYYFQPTLIDCGESMDGFKYSFKERELTEIADPSRGHHRIIYHEARRQFLSFSTSVCRKTGSDSDGDVMTESCCCNDIFYWDLRKDDKWRRYVVKFSLDSIRLYLCCICLRMSLKVGIIEKVRVRFGVWS